MTLYNTKGLSPGMHLGVASALGVTVFLLVSFGLVPYISAQLRERHRQGRGGVVRTVVMCAVYEYLHIEKSAYFV